MNTNMTIFASTLVVGATIHSKATARITGDKVGAENYAKWKSAMTVAHDKFYAYKYAVDRKARGKDADVTGAKTAAMNALQVILDLVGPINDFALVKDEEIFENFAHYAVAEKTELAGEAYYINSQIKNLKDELKNTNGANPEWVEAKEKELAEKEEALKVAKKSANSGKPVDKKTGFNTFCANFERKLAKLAGEQSMKSPEELAAEKEARRKARREATKAKKAEKKAAEANA